MYNFNTTITRTRERCGLELLAIAGDADQDEDDLDPEEEIHFEVQVDYDPGWFQPGKFSGLPEDCYPDEGEDPELLRVVTLDDDEQEVDILDDLTREEYQSLVEQAWADQKQAQKDDEYDSDAAYDDYIESVFMEAEYGDDY